MKLGKLGQVYVITASLYVNYQRSGLVGVCTPGVSLATGTWRVDHMTLLRRNDSSTLHRPRRSHIGARARTGPSSLWLEAVMAQAAENARSISEGDRFPKNGGHVPCVPPEGALLILDDRYIRGGNEIHKNTYVSCFVSDTFGIHVSSQATYHGSTSRRFFFAFYLVKSWLVWLHT